MTTILLQRAEHPDWHLGFCLEKLTLRGQLPGASIFDTCGATIQMAAAAGLSTQQLLPLAMPTSWMVNNTVTSPHFQEWLTPQHQAHWVALLDALAAHSKAWTSTPAATRAEMQALVDTLYLPSHGLAGLTKVLASLLPDTVPLMDDAALWFALGTPLAPHDPTKPGAPSALFLPMLDWFDAHTQAQAIPLQQIASQYPQARLSPAQVLDRLLWFESWGFHLFSNQAVWRWIAHQQKEAIVPVVLEPHLPASFTAEPKARQPWPDQASDDWQEGTIELLDCIYQEVIHPPTA